MNPSPIDSTMKPFDPITQGGSFCSVVMHSTFRISSIPGPVERVHGTGFVLSRPSKTNPGTRSTILVTANHVFEQLPGPSARLLLRRGDDSAGWKQSELEFTIRHGEQETWTRNEICDLAATAIQIPSDCIPTVLTTDILLSEEAPLRVGFNPGDRIFCAGFPLGFGSACGFPFLRTGTVASYPVLPIVRHPIFQISCEIYPGNSGGPVFIAPSIEATGASGASGRVTCGIVGMVLRAQVKQEIAPEGMINHFFGIGNVIHAAVIKEFLETVPEL